LHLPKAFLTNRIRWVLTGIGMVLALLALRFLNLQVFVASTLLVIVLFFYREDFHAAEGSYNVSRRALSVLEIGVLACIIALIFLSENSIRPQVFFPLAATYYLLLFIDAIQSNASVSAYVLKWTVGQIVIIGSFYLLYPGFVGVDSYRDLHISASIIANSGGLPKDFTNIIWYDFTPMASLLYSITSLSAHVTVANAERAVGFAFLPVSVLLAGCLGIRFTGSTRVGLLTIWIGGLMPWLWISSTWPIPETLGICLALSSLVVVSRAGRQSMPAFILLAVSVVFTHGGIALELLFVLLLIYFLTRSAWATHAIMVISATLLVYSTYAAAVGAPYGLSTYFASTQSLLAPSPALFSASLSLNTAHSILVSAGEALSNAYPMIFLFSFALIGLDRVLRQLDLFSVKSVGILLAFCVYIAGGAVFAIIGSSTSAGRYVGLLGYAAGPIVAAIGLAYFLNSARRTRILAVSFVCALVVASTTSVAVAPDFWQNAGQTQFAVKYRIGFSSTVQELQVEQYLNAYDNAYLVAANVLPEYINLRLTSFAQLQPTYPGSAYYLSGVAFGFTPSGPYLALVSNRAVTSHFPLANTAASLNNSSSDLVYSNAATRLIFVPQ
jgi:hypothetical protein